MAIDFTDIYSVNEFVREIEKKHIPLNDDVMNIGIFGYFREVHSNILQNAAISISENALEALPTKAKFPRNILTHAHSHGLETNATPAYMKVVLYLPEDAVEKNLNEDNILVIDREYPIKIIKESDETEYRYHLDYDIIIRRVTLPSKETVYTALYDMNVKNPLSNINNPYIPTIGRFTITDTKILAIQTVIRQYDINVQEKTLLTSNPLSNKTFSFSFEDQLAAFWIEVEEPENTYSLSAVYDGLIDKTASYYCNYLYLEEDTIRVIFKKESYQPRVNCNVKIHTYTTKGAEANFNYTGRIQCDLKSDRFTYNGLWMIVNPITESMDGEDTKTVEQLKKIIPTEMLARGSTTNTTDLNNFFNSINNDDRRIYFLPKLDSLDRLYYSYVAFKQDGNLIPTNTIDIELLRKQFDHSEKHNYVLYPGNMIYYLRGHNGTIVSGATEEEIEDYRSKGFLYFNPFMMVINKNPFYVSYLITILRVIRELGFDFINQNCPAQFVATDILWKREYFTDRNTYKMMISLLQNIDTDTFNLVEQDGDGIRVNIKVIAVLYGASGNAYRWVEGRFNSYDDTNRAFKFEIDIDTNNRMDSDNNMCVTNCNDLLQTFHSKGYLPENTKVNIYVLAKTDEYYGNYNLGDYVPESVIGGWTVCNMYSVLNGVPMYFNYSRVISTFVNVEQGYDSSLKYYVKKVPVIKYDYITDEERLFNIIDNFELIRTFLEYKLSTIEDGFGIDIKFFNTYGPAEFFQVDDGVYLNSTSISTTWKTQLKPGASSTCIDEMKSYIKTYIEDLNKLNDFHAPNLQSAVYEQFKDQIDYFEFVDFNGYGPTWQHIYREEFEKHITKVPEMLAVNIKVEDGEPDITIISVKN